MCTGISGLGINQSALRAEQKAPKEFKKLDDAIDFAAKNKGDEVITQVGEGENKKFVVVDIEKNISSESVFDPSALKFNKSFISRDNGKIEVASNPENDSPQVEMLSELTDTAKKGNSVSLSNMKDIYAKTTAMEQKLQSQKATASPDKLPEIEQKLQKLGELKVNLDAKIKNEESFIGIMDELKGGYINPANLSEKNQKIYRNFTGKIDLSKREGFEKNILEILQNPEKRKVLIEKFHLNTPENVDRLVLTMVNEAHGGAAAGSIDPKKPDADKARAINEDVFPIGASALNKHLMNLLLSTSSHYVNNHESMDGYKPFSLEHTLLEKTTGGSPMVAFAAFREANGTTRFSTEDERKTKLAVIKNDYQAKGEDSAHSIDFNAARKLLQGEVEFDLKKTDFQDSKTSPKQPNLSPGKTSFKVTDNGDSYKVNAGAFFAYASTADTTTDILDKKRGFIRTPNTHKIGTYAPNRGLMIKEKYLGAAVKD